MTNEAIAKMLITNSSYIMIFLSPNTSLQFCGKDNKNFQIHLLFYHNFLPILSFFRVGGVYGGVNKKGDCKILQSPFVDPEGHDPTTFGL